MENIFNDRRYLSMVQDIIDHEEFQKTKNYVHHMNNRFDHSVRVSYYSYKICKLLRLNEEQVARAGLLHDFFLVDNHALNKKDRYKNMVMHPKDAVENAKKYFDLSDMEEDIIRTHMFPVAPSVPKYLESWIVDAVDDVVAIYEASLSTKKQLATVGNLVMLFMLKILR